MQTLILGFDAFDPAVFERLSAQGKLPNLTRYVEAGGYARLSVVNPPQTEVSWTSLATGLDPGGHGIFDFVHRDPVTYTPYLSLLPTKRGLFGTQFVPPHKTRTIFEEATRKGYPATALWWPATFPARPELPIRTFPGLGTPDIQGRWGVGTLLSSADEPADEKRKTPVVPLERRANDQYVGLLMGPKKKTRSSYQQCTTPLFIDKPNNQSARLTIGTRTIELVEGKWSPIVNVAFKMGRFFTFGSLTRVILTQVRPHIRLYVLPLQLHPLHTPWRYATPRAFVKQLWNACGPFLTLGWPQDTVGLEEGWITNSQFLDLCESILKAREQALMYQLRHFSVGILASVFDSLDRVQHMFRRDRPDVVDEWYVKLDALVGRVEKHLTDLGQGQTKILVVSDHGFTEFDHKVHLNRWLIERGYLVTTENGACGCLQDVDWVESRAYGVGLNSLYLNLEGREGQGSVNAQQVEPLVNRICNELSAWSGPDRRPVVQRVMRKENAFHGPLAGYGPDIVVGFAPGYRASAETGLGKWEKASVEPNHDHWGADHCVDSQAVPGVVFCSQGLADFDRPSYRDFPALAIGTTFGTGDAPPPPSFDKEEQEILEDRLKGLGYL